MTDEFEFEPVSFEPKFLSTDDRIDEINKWLEDFMVLREEALEENVDRINHLQEKINQLYYQLELLKKKNDEIKIEFARKRREYNDEREALIEAKKRQELADQFEETAKLIKEIVEDFAAWKMARHYQMEDIVATIHQYIIGEPGVMNANEMALGKTFEAIVSLYIIRELFKRKYNKPPSILFLTKSSIIKTGGTVREFQRWDPDFKLIPLNGSAPAHEREFSVTMARSSKFGLITNYEACRTTKNLLKYSWDIVVMDEVHKLKGGANVNGATAVWTAVRDVCKRSKFIIMLTGTPLVNKAEEMWSYMHIFAPDEFPSAKDFTKRFTGFRQAAGTFKMSIDAEKLFKMALKGRLIRRTASEVGLELPQVIRQDVYVEHTEKQAEIYEQMRTKFFIWLAETKKPLTANNILTQLLRLRQINVLPVANFKIKDDEGNIVETIQLNVRESGKLDECVRMLVEHNQQAVGFCNFNEPMNELAFRLQVEGKSVALINSDYANEMGTYETEFQQGRIDVLLINSAMGEGLNLHKDPEKWPGGAGVGFTLDRWWNNARNDQCFKRVVRPGAPGPIFFYDYYVEHSVDEYIRYLCDEKDEQFNSVTEHDAARPREEVKALLEKLL